MDEATLRWLLPVVLSVVTGGGAAYMAVKVSIAKLEYATTHALERLEQLHKRVHGNSNNILIHDMEIGELMRKSNMRRRDRRQAFGEEN